MARRLVAVAAVVVALVYWPRNERVTEEHQLAGTPPTLQEKTTEPVATFIAGDDTSAVEIESGLQEGDKVIISSIDQFCGADTVLISN